ncbi:hypothetical protein Baya_12765 [Bagarius yarrelli]|uniref:Uncharacterized protein n=1 Tax=Bagarius yarrelli TaxID=175774 RepID=A0A556V3T8_BAGYA|nr:hypothetical protein Baya_12765 [Bagarius yarrelli]
MCCSQERNESLNEGNRKQWGHGIEMRLSCQRNRMSSYGDPGSVRQRERERARRRRCQGTEKEKMNGKDEGTESEWKGRNGKGKMKGRK